MVDGSQLFCFPKIFREKAIYKYTIYDHIFECMGFRKIVFTDSQDKPKVVSQVRKHGKHITINTQIKIDICIPVLCKISEYQAKKNTVVLKFIPYCLKKTRVLGEDPDMSSSINQSN